MMPSPALELDKKPGQEIVLYNDSDCGPTSTWSKLYTRIHGLEASKDVLRRIGVFLSRVGRISSPEQH